MGITLIYESYIDHLLNILSHRFFSHMLSHSRFQRLCGGGVLMLKGVLRGEDISYLLFSNLIVLFNHLFELLKHLKCLFAQLGVLLLLTELF